MLVQPVHPLDEFPGEEGASAAVSPHVTSHFPQQLSSLAQSLAVRFEEIEAERHEMHARIRTLEDLHHQYLQKMSALQEKHQESLDKMQALKAVQDTLHEARGGVLSTKEVESVQQLTKSLVENPENILVLARISESAARLGAIVEDYARVCQALAEA